MSRRSTLHQSEADSGATVPVGHRTGTDVVAGMEAGLETILVLSTSTRSEDRSRLPYPVRRTPAPAADAVDSA